MKKSLALVLGVLLAAVWGLPAQAAKTSVAGTNAYTKLVLLNKQSHIRVKMFGPGGEPCSVKYVYATVRDQDGTRYTLSAGCYPGLTWAVSLSRGDNLVTCDGATLDYVAADGYWKGTMPRTCLRRLADRVKVTASGIDDYSPTPGEAGPTKYVARG